MPDSVGPDMLAGTAWAGAHRKPVAGDASSRRYERLTLGDQKAILMISDEETHTFVSLARLFRRHGFSAPKILADIPGGLIIEDLGNGIFARIAESEPAREGPLYRAAAHCLVEFQRIPLPDLTRMTPAGLGGATDLAFIWYAPKDQSGAHVADAFSEAFDQLDDLTSVLVHRDFHAENLLWLGNRDGVAKVGLIDFQDALIGHPAYDLVSLLADARRDLSPGLADHMILQFADQTGRDLDALRYACALFGAQRNLRILGVFARLAARDGKIVYLDLMPRVWRHLNACLAHPKLGGIRALLNTLPPPDPTFLAKLRT